MDKMLTFGCDPEKADRGPGGWIHLGHIGDRKDLRKKKCYIERMGKFLDLTIGIERGERNAR